MGLNYGEARSPSKTEYGACIGTAFLLMAARELVSFSNGHALPQYPPFLPNYASNGASL
jgi:hypothetical protein